MFKRVLIMSLVLAIVTVTVSALSENPDTGYSAAVVNSTDSGVIIIDAGHGGFDGGAVAYDGTLEKDLNLEVALELERVAKALGLKTVMVRTTDKSTDSDGEQSGSRKVKDIKNRLALMKKYENSIFISIHMNKYSTSQPNGAQVFYSPYKGSDVLAERIQKSVAEHLQPNNKRVIKPATRDIYLLYNATTPAVIVECGFLSNPNDLQNLCSKNYRNELAFAILCGIMVNGSQNSNVSTQNL